MPSRNVSSDASPKTNCHSTQLSLELELLQNLCRTGLKRISPDAIAVLSHRSWAAPDHQIVFQAISRLANISPAALRHQLPAEATRMGFPDVAWEKFLVSSNECKPSRTTTELIAALAASSR